MYVGYGKLRKGGLLDEPDDLSEMCRDEVGSLPWY